MSSLEKLPPKTAQTLAELVEVSSYKNSLVVKHFANMDLTKALQSTSPSVGILSKTNEEKVLLGISNLMIGTSKYFDKTLTERQGEVIAEEILAKYEYRQLRYEDILAVCIEIKESDTFKLTPARFLRFISNYVHRREIKAIEMSQNASERAKSMSGESNIDERIRNSARLIANSNKIVVKNRLNAKKYK